MMKYVAIPPSPHYSVIFNQVKNNNNINIYIYKQQTYKKSHIGIGNRALY